MLRMTRELRERGLVSADDEAHRVAILDRRGTNEVDAVAPLLARRI
jgi:hypothetical protein